MKELSELEMRILSELEEAGEETVVTLLNTLTDKTGGDLEIASLQMALETLVHAELARISVKRAPSAGLLDASKSESLAVLAELPLRLRFNREKRFWSDHQIDPPFQEQFPYIVYTDAGRKKGFEILDERGYQWWRQKK